MITSGLVDLENEMKEMPEYEIENWIQELLDAKNTVKDILYVNDRIQQGLVLKIMTAEQMLSRLPITLAQIKAENNSEKLKDEIRRLFYLWIFMNTEKSKANESKKIL